jgi:hypothetical protein
MTWIRWFRGKVRLDKPRWRSGASVLGFALTTVSLWLILVLATYALIAGGVPYYHPALMLSMRVGVFSALAGRVAAFIGTGQLESPTIAVSGLCLLIWFVEGVAL